MRRSDQADTGFSGSRRFTLSNPPQSGRTVQREDQMSIHDVANLLIIGISQGCAYGLVALGFVLIYKATEIVNFSHGEFMMLGAFATLPLIAVFGFWLGVLCAILAVAVVGFLMD